MKKAFDVLVLGLGANGSSALYHLSQTDLQVGGIDRFAPPHHFGSSHGQSRIIRQAYHESPMYVPLVKEAYQLWFALEKNWGKQLFLQTGGLMLGAPDSSVVYGARLSAETHGIAHEMLSSEEVQQRFPALKTGSDTAGVLEVEAGILFPEECIRANLTLAKNNGASLMLNEQVIAIETGNDSVHIITDKNKYQTRKLVVSAGAWLNQLLPELKLPLTIERQVLYWYQNTNPLLQASLLPNALPIYIWEYEKGKLFYGLPDLGDGLKVARHHAGQSIQPDLLSQYVSEEEKESMNKIINQYLNIEARFHYTSVCMYTNTPDEHFILDYHPRHSNIIVGSPCSGHGFKFSSVTGKILADMALEKRIAFDLQPFRIGRFF